MSYEAPSFNDLQMKLSEATMIALSLRIALPPFSMGEGISCQHFIDVDRETPLLPGKVAKAA